ncbi:extracellular solute-binding protein [Sediminicoccus sp. KRV36]|uniref:ABC transporter substrate-binding protein n=1 Tax=Sediminicoccus sp. KRV36 TaxID=3133721 RepID=UPI00200EECB5|nr:extracellular solute-binding protein [Sediminicoccus rosea]UPY37048.1 extracellular solute-binding protein [Sediminicoccus rosea]
MSLPPLPAMPRRALLGTGLATALTAPATAQPTDPQTVNFVSWTATESTQAAIREQIATFMTATGLRVAHQHFPWSGYRTALLARMLNEGPADVIWLSDAWLPEFAEAGWVSPINDIPALTRFNPDTRLVCQRGVSFRGQQYGLGYYTDNMCFLYNQRMLERAGFAEPPKTWNEVVQQAQVIRQRGLSASPLGLALAPDPWLIEIISTLVFSFGGAFIGPTGEAVMADQPQTRAALQFLLHMIRHERIVAPDAVKVSEDEMLEAFGQGRHAFAILPSYRLRSLNNPAQFAEAGSFRVALMPNGGDAQRHETCGWVRMYALTSAAASNLQRLRNAVTFLEAFGGRDQTGQYAMAKRLLLYAGLPFCPTPLYTDPEVNDYVTEWSRGSSEILRSQLDSVRNKDTISPWFGNWQALTDPLWPAICLGTLAPEAALGLAAEAWSRLQRTRN